LNNILIIGQGLAGTVLSHYCERAGLSFKVLDNNHKTASTKAAAGLINPITGRSYVKTWLIDELLPESIQCYNEISKILDVDLCTSRKIIRSLPTAAAENKWMSASSKPGNESYMEDEYSADEYQDLVHKSGAYGLIHKGWQINISKMIVLYRAYLLEKSRLISSEFSYDSIDANSPLEIDGEVYDTIVFSEGSQVVNNPYFNYLPFQPVKGESFKIRIEGKTPDAILRDEIFLVPESDQSFWSGGGYEKDYDDHLPSQAFKDSWNQKLQNLLNISYEVIEHNAGIRPSVKGRRPLIGRHPKYPNLILFNGFGTKGTSLSPYFAKNLLEHLVNGADIHPEADLNRFPIN